MKFNVVDYLIRKFSSLVLRIIIILYANFIVYYSSENVLNYYFYLIGSCVYFLNYQIFLSKDKKKLRLLNDFGFIYFILYGKNLQCFNNIVFLLLPIFNAPNHISGSRPMLLFITPALIYYQLTYIRTGEPCFNFIVGFIFLLIISYLEFFRSRIRLLNESLFNLTDDYNFKNVNYHKIHRVYKDVIEKVNASIIPGFKVDKLLCLRIKDKKISIVNSSDFIWKLSINDSDLLITELRKNKKADNFKIQLDKNIYKINNLLYFEEQSYEYAFVIIWDQENSLLFQKFFTEKIFLSFFSKISKILAFQQSMRQERNKNLKNIRENYEYVNHATLAMHFLRNKFSPITNYFQMVLQLEKERDPTIKKAIIKLIKQEKRNVTYSIKSILQRTNFILEKSKNPFIASDIKRHKVRFLFVTTKTIWNDYFGDDLIDPNIEELATRNFIEFDLETMELVLNDLISNIEKYNNGIKRLVFSFDEDNLYITFKNSVETNASNTKEIDLIIKNFMSDQKFEITKRKTHGLMHVKQFLIQMNISYSLKLESKFFIFTLIFKRYKNENSDI